MNINRNTMGHLEVPDFILAKASGERVGVLQCTHKVWTKKYNDIDTLSFEIPYMKDDVLTKYYDDIDVMKYIEVPTLSASFAIKDIDIENEGQKTEYKRVECQSRECLLAQKYLEDFSINTGTTGAIDGVSFCNSVNTSKSLLHLVLEKFPDWSISSSVSASLKSMKRSFEVTRQSIYDFLVNDVSEAFECIFIFDSFNKTIGAYTQEEYGIDCNMHVGYNALLQNTSLSYSIDDIKTAVTLQGDDDTVNVREVNIGNNIIYNFDYYASEEYMSASLLTAYNTWKNLVNTTVDTSLFTYKPGVITQAELQGKTYSQAYTLLLTKYQDYYTRISQWRSTMIPDGINTRHPGYGKILYKDSSGKDYYITFTKPSKWMLVGSDEPTATIDVANKVYTAPSLPSTGDVDTLYLMKNTNVMRRWYSGKYYDVNTWIDCCLATLKEHQKAAEENQAVAMKSSYGDRNVNATEYIRTYLPQLYTYNALAKQIETVNAIIVSLEGNQEIEGDQEIIQADKEVIVNKVDMKNNFTVAQLKELSMFIREEEVTSSNFLVTDVMTEEERFEMLYALLDYGQKELAKVAAPQIQFSAGLNNLFAIPEFDTYSGDFDIGNYVWVTLRDDYSVKAKILEIEIDFLDQSNFSVTFGNIMKKAKNIFTDVTEALNAATSAATSVSFNQSYWSSSAENTDSIGKALADGLLDQSYYLSNAANNETLIDKAGVWITTTDDRQHGRDFTDNYDSIYLGGGRILFTDDGWRSVRMSVGRSNVKVPHVDESTGNYSMVTESRFGTYADFLIAGYIGGSTIVGGHIYSDNYKSTTNKNSGNYGTHIDLRDGTFEFNSKTSPGKKRLTLNSDGVLEVNGVIHAKEGNIGSDDNGANGFIIKEKRLYMNRDSFNSTSNGIYIGFENSATNAQGISLGPYNSTTKRNPFSVDVTGTLTANKGTIANFILTDSSMYTNIDNTKRDAIDKDAKGVFIGDTGIGLGKRVSYTTASGGTESKSTFQVDNNGTLYAGNINVKGRVTATTGYIGNGASGFTITSTSIYNGKTTLTDRTNAQGVYIGTNGISLGRINTGTTSAPVYADAFSVTSGGVLTSTSGKIGGWTISTDALYNNKNSLTAAKEGVFIGQAGISLGYVDSRTPFSVTNEGYLKSVSGEIGGWKINDTSLSKSVSGVGSIALDASNCLINVNNKIYVSGNGTLYTGSKTTRDADANGIYIGTDGIGLGYNNKFRVDEKGALKSTSGNIGGWTISTNYLATGKTSITDKKAGIFIGQTGISLGYDETNDLIPFVVTSAGKLTSTSGSIGGWSISTDSISRSTKIGGNNTKITLDATNNKINVNDKIFINGNGTINTGSKTTRDSDANGIYIGTDGIGLGYNNKFRVDEKGALKSTSGEIGGWTINSTNIKHSSDSGYISLDASKKMIDVNGKIQLKSDGSLVTNSGLFKVGTDGKLTATGGSIGGWEINTTSLSKKGTNGTITLDASKCEINVNNKIYINGEGTIHTGSKTGLDTDSNGIFISTAGIALGYQNKFKVTNEGYLTATSGKIGGWNITSNALSNGKLKDGVPNIDAEEEGIFIGQTGISMGKPTVDSDGNLIHKFKVTNKGNLTATSGQIGGFTITNSKLYSGKSSIGNANNGVYIGTDGIAFGYDPVKGKTLFYVTEEGELVSRYGTIGGFKINLSNDDQGQLTDNYALYTGNKTALNSKVDGVHISSEGISLGSSTYDSTTKTWTSHKFRVTKAGSLYATSGHIGGFDMTSTKLYNGKSSISDANNGVFIGTTGIALGYNTTEKTTPFYVTSEGKLVSRYGTIGGWNISNYSLESPASKDGDQTIINSNGSLRHWNTGTSKSNWSIQTNGTATFSKVYLNSDVHIADVAKGSSFGQLSINNNGNTIYDSWSKSPFTGNCSDHIQTLALDKLEVAWLDGDYIKADLLTADNIKTGTLAAERIDADKLKVKAANITGTLTADQIETNKLKIGATQITGTTTISVWSGYERKQLQFPDGDGVTHTINYVDHLTDHYKLAILGKEAESD